MDGLDKMQGERSELQILILMTFASACWAGAFIAGKLGLSDFTPLTMTLYRYLIASVIIIPYMWKTGKRNKARILSTASSQKRWCHSQASLSPPIRVYGKPLLTGYVLEE